MVELFFQQDTRGLWRGFDVSGHAGCGVKGEDIVCAAISAVTQTAALGLGAYISENELSVSKKSGFLACTVKTEKAAEKPEVQAVLNTAYLGLKATEESYSEYLKVRVESGKLESWKVEKDKVES